MERPPRPRTPELIPDDFEHLPEVRLALLQFPKELRERHLLHIEDEKLSDADAATYVMEAYERRESALHESHISDPSIEPLFAGREREIWNALETEVLHGEHNFLGAGQTARVKAYDLTGEDRTVPIAVKYLLTPTAKTLSASGEHDLIREVELITKVERAEQERAGEMPHMRVPHPFFHFKSRKVQCYGMERIDGLDLQRYIEGEGDPELRVAIAEAFAGVTRDAIDNEVDVFFDIMHTVCLHGDIKPANLMVSRDGRIMPIDLGQAVLTNNISEADYESFENLKEDEKKKAKLVLAIFLRKAHEEGLQQAA